MTGAEFMEAGRPRLLPKARLRYDEVRGRHVLLLPERAVVLSDTAAQILQLCDGGRTGAELIQALQTKYPGADLRSDVVEFLGEAVKKRWVEWLLPP
jgi:pyrroloquinoline quinone biosynthesis protein D